MYKIGENEMVLCPYNRSHIVSKLRLQRHIVKCKEHYPDVKLVTCFYNYTHRLRPEEVLKHYEICAQKIRMEEARYCKSQYDFFTRTVTNSNSIYDMNNDKASLLGNHKTSFVLSSVNENAQDTNFSASGVNQACENEPLKLPKTVSKAFTNKKDGVDDLKPLKLPKTVSKAFTCKKDGVEDLKPLNLPKTVSKAFNCKKNDVEDLKPLNLPNTASKTVNVLNEQLEKPTKDVPVSKPVTSSRGFGRGQNFAFASTAPPRTNDHLLPDVSDIDSRLPKDVKSKFFRKIEADNSCSASVISSVFDDGTTMKSDDITFVDDDDDDDDGFIFKNFDKYIKI